MSVKSAGILLALWIGASQTVQYTDCACGAVCEDKGECRSCPSPQPARPGCCPDHEPAPAPADRGCIHLEPSRETTLDLSAPTPPILVTASSVPTEEAAPAVPPAEAPPVRKLPRPPREGPLHLLNSVLLI